MPIDRFYFHGDLLPHSTISITGAEHHHLAHVVRLREGELVELVNGQGSLATGKIANIDKRAAIVELFSSSRLHPPTPRIELAIPFMRPSKLEWIVEKGTEIGVHAFLFYAGDYSELSLIRETQRERLRAVAVAALKQSGRLYLPTFEILPHLEPVLREEARIFFGDTRPSAEDSTKEFWTWLAGLAGSPRIVFATGSEKGFSEGELGLLCERGTGVCLNPNILRAETAPIVAASILGQLLTKSAASH